MAILPLAQYSTTVKTLRQSNNPIFTPRLVLIHTLYLAALFQRLLSVTTFSLCVHLSLFTFYTTRLLALNSYYASKLLIINLLTLFKLMATRLVSSIWKRTEKARRKLFFELVIWILNPNAVALLVFWPGWIALAGVYFAYSYYVSR